MILIINIVRYIISLNENGSNYHPSVVKIIIWVIALTLDQVKKGQLVKIAVIPDELMRIQAIRFGIDEGTVVTCREVVPAGPVVVARNKQEIAIGRGLASIIRVEPC